MYYSSQGFSYVSTLDDQNVTEADDLDLVIFEDEDEEILQFALDPVIGLENASAIEEDEPNQVSE
ncbi:MAG: hypothetical protein JOZ78_07755 [Chroococcidiopsidaceae cyanobacterium CP_BM_ER_R8_30]|nr:hypothetical protein [Chroococcidiopsidaceae cyanobacterium CP_BM_ER_R8_30]